MESHNHPAYEDTFQRIATILDVLAEDQVKQEQALGRLTDALTQLTDRTAEWAQRNTEWAQRSAETEIKLRALAERNVEAEARLNAKLEKLAEKSAETEDKLNALIDLMDHHQREHNQENP